MQYPFWSGMRRSHAPAGVARSGGQAQKKEMARFSAVSKRFAGVTVVDSVSLVSHAGTVHAITGENGAGKSTLMKMLAGVHQPSDGTIQVDGTEFAPADPRDAQNQGVSTIYQELNLISNLTVAENLFFGREPKWFGQVERRALMDLSEELLARTGFEIDPNRPCGDLTIAEQQFVEIAKGVGLDANIYIFDEPTAALNGPEAERLFQLINGLRDAGKLIYYISHRLDEIFRLSDRIAVLKDGRLSADFARGETDETGLIRAMVGRDLGDYFPPRRVNADQPVKMSVSDLQTRPDGPRVSFDLRQGEILGLAGLEGQGQRDVIRAIVGLEPPSGGTVTINVKQAQPQKGIVAMVRDGVGFVPEDRKGEGLYLQDSIEQNVSLGFLRRAGLFSRAHISIAEIKDVNQKMRLKADGPNQKVKNLSGGNQQKVMLARWLVAGVQVLVVEEPTRGVDVGAKAEIYAALRAFCAEGNAILLTSSEMSEVIGLCDRILVMRGGRIAGEMQGTDATEERILEFAITDKATVQ